MDPNRRTFEPTDWEAWWETILDTVDQGSLVGIWVNPNEDAEVALTATNFWLDPDTQACAEDEPEYAGLVAVERAREWAAL